MAFAAERSAVGKIILLGEHAVVHGATALVAGLDRGARVRAVLAATPQLRVAVGAEATLETAEQEILEAFCAIAAALSAPNCAVDVRFELPVRAGLGSSAAFSVAVARALAGVAGGRSKDQIAAAALAAERVFHGNPSGVDTAAAAHGGFGTFSREHGYQPLKAAPLRLCVGLSGMLRDTRGRVANVATLQSALGAPVDAIFAAVSALCEEGKRALVAGDLPRLGGLMDLNQGYLNALGVSTAALELLCFEARDAGALGAKLTGAGGGGAVVALVDGEAAAASVLAAWRRVGFEGFDVTVRSEP